MPPQQLRMLNYGSLRANGVVANKGSESGTWSTGGDRLASFWELNNCLRRRFRRRFASTALRLRSVRPAAFEPKADAALTGVIRARVGEVDRRATMRTLTSTINKKTQGILVMKLKCSELCPKPDAPFDGDVFDRRPFIDSLTNLVRNVSPPFVISIDGRWGSGKTTHAT